MKQPVLCKRNGIGKKVREVLSPKDYGFEVKVKFLILLKYFLAAVNTASINGLFLLYSLRSFFVTL
jgi:hypothetical protein